MAHKLSRRALAGYLVAQDVSKEAVTQVAAYLTASRRTKEADMIARDVAATMAAHGQVYGTLTTAAPLSKALHADIETMVAATTKADDVQLEAIINPAVIGGFLVEVPGRRQDATVATALSQLTHETRKV